MNLIVSVSEYLLFNKVASSPDIFYMFEMHGPRMHLNAA